MEEQIKQTAKRLRGLREVLDIDAADAAQTCGISTEDYLEFESGKIDIPVSILYKIAHKYGIELTVLLTGEDPHMHRYAVTRKNSGAGAERTSAYKYQALAQSFINRKGQPFIVTCEPKPDSTTVHLNTHSGQEFNFILEGRMTFFINNKEIILEEGDSVYFDSGQPHGMLALDDKQCRFLAIIL
ncbi:transcriptional regulator, XRE family with cupin sensor [Mariniphaga anaerophila]|uniref:Transcriptional regulator, XRE family with cupin sensor n=1 Tax=Mariniphaga anaerophila TaxID=1484053 RepID=A0A1M4SXH2_9BACT|nr:cupin domain-containing protein [Mariniphaga anaerophila]SHE36878.1 transcriptional regulator, XRE family with cupin sensor [Mariniphaga anaerophila]